MAVDMETATLFSTGFFNEIPTGALLLVSDQPMIPEGIKTAQSDRKVTREFLDMHLRIGIDALKELNIREIEQRIEQMRKRSRRTLRREPKMRSLISSLQLLVANRHLSQDEATHMIAAIENRLASDADVAEADGVVTIKGGGPDIVVRMDEHGSRKGMCAIAMITNVGRAGHDRRTAYLSDGVMVRRTRRGRRCR